MDIDFKLIPNTKNKAVSGLVLATLLNVKEPTVNSWGSRYDMPRYGKKYLLEGALKIVLDLKNTGKSGKGMETKDRASRILSYLDNGCEIESESTTAAEFSPTELVLGKEKGIEAALERIRVTEVYLSEQASAVVDNPSMFKVAMKNWQDCLELLRKTEADALKVLEQQRILVRLDEALELYNKGIAPTQTKLRALPAAIASDLEDQDQKTIQEILEKEIDRALDGIANIMEVEEDED